VGIVLEEVLEEAPKWKVLWVSDSVFVSFSSLSGAAVFSTDYLLHALYARTVCFNLFGNGHCTFTLHKKSILYYNVIDEDFRILPNMVCVAYVSNYCLLC
jgi:hypothetical protein